VSRCCMTSFPAPPRNADIRWRKGFRLGVSGERPRSPDRLRAVLEGRQPATSVPTTAFLLLFRAFEVQANPPPGQLVIISGTGTSIGKTHFGEALIQTWGRLGRVVGLKPIESGVGSGMRTDANRLAAASSFHVKQEGYAFGAAVSPHLAARYEGTEIRADFVVKLIERARQQADVVVVELPGGLFSPIAPGVLNADLAKTLSATCVLLVVPDRLGALHDVVAATRAASGGSLRVDGIVLMAPDQVDASTGHNAPELRHLVAVPVLAALPRAPPAVLSKLPEMTQLVETLRRR
jgi:dethiobiotin synthetase